MIKFYPRFVPALSLPVWDTASVRSWGQDLCTHESVRCWSSVYRAGVCLLPWDQAWISVSSWEPWYVAGYWNSSAALVLGTEEQWREMGGWSGAEGQVAGLLTRQEVGGTRFVMTRQTSLCFESCVLLGFPGAKHSDINQMVLPSFWIHTLLTQMLNGLSNYLAPRSNHHSQRVVCTICTTCWSSCRRRKCLAQEHRNPLPK